MIDNSPEANIFRRFYKLCRNLIDALFEVSKGDLFIMLYILLFVDGIRSNAIRINGQRVIRILTKIKGIHTLGIFRSLLYFVLVAIIATSDR